MEGNDTFGLLRRLACLAGMPGAGGDRLRCPSRTLLCVSCLLERGRRKKGGEKEDASWQVPMSMVAKSTLIGLTTESTRQRIETEGGFCKKIGVKYMNGHCSCHVGSE
jgi:hypothetical protein